MDLEYNLFYSSNNEMDFKVLNNKIIKYDNLYINFSIIGASHFVQIREDVQQTGLLELLSCIRSLDKKKTGLVHNKELAYSDEIKYEYRIMDRYNYQFQFNIISTIIEDYDNFLSKVVSDNNNYLDFIFPSEEGIAFTGIEYFTDKDRVRWMTYHSYPNEGKLVKTESVLERS